MSNPNNCNTCDHKQHPDGGHCYMFRDEPRDVCMQHTGRRMSEDLSKCPQCGGDSDNGHDRCYPPTAFIKPCDLPCQKCGSDDVHRKFNAKGAEVENDKHDRCDNRYAVGQCNFWKSVRDHLDHKCRCCGYRWQTFPLSKRKRSAA